MRVSRGLATVFLALALAAGQAGVCAGWMASPEARMACCSDDGPCPMHKSDSEGDESAPVLSQADADRCCAASEQDDGARSPSGQAFCAVLGIVLRPVPALMAVPPAHVELWRASAPIPTAHIPKHLLLSVFLV